MILTKQENGHVIELRVGDVFAVRLEENPTTGYRWWVDPIAGVEAVGQEYEGPGAGVGAGGYRVLRFHATTAGSHDLRMKNWREWQGEASVTDRFQVTVHVR